MIGTEITEIEVAMPLALRNAAKSIALALDEKIDIPTIGDVYEAEIIEDTVRAIIHAVISLVPPSLFKAFSDRSSGLEPGFLDRVILNVASKVAAKISFPCLNLSDEQEAELIWKVCKALLGYLAPKEALPSAAGDNS
jgi:hypothetical protein